MFKFILCPITGNVEDRVALDSAAVLAEAFSGHVAVLHAKPDAKEIAPYLGEGMTASAIESIIADAERRAEAQAQAAKAMFASWQAARGLAIMTSPASVERPSTSWHGETGAEDAWIVRLGRLSDLIVLRPPGVEGGTSATLAVEAALLDTGRPLLLAGGAGLVADAGAVIAWNGSAEAARALGGALPLLARARDVRVLTIDEGGRATDPEAVVAYLAWHRIRARAERIAAGRDGTEAAIDAACRSAGAGLLVMGGYTHSRLRELIFGGVTAHVLRRTRLPVLMLH